MLGRRSGPIIIRTFDLIHVLPLLLMNASHTVYLRHFQTHSLVKLSLSYILCLCPVVNHILVSIQLTCMWLHPYLVISLTRTLHSLHSIDTSIFLIHIIIHLPCSPPTSTLLIHLPHPPTTHPPTSTTHPHVLNPFRTHFHSLIKLWDPPSHPPGSPRLKRT